MTLGLTLFLILAGAAAGLLGSLLGLGGGILIIPMLVLVLHVPMHIAIATSLLCVIATSSAAASKNVSRGIANVRLGMTMELWTVVGALAGSLLAGRLSGSTLTLIFGVAMGIMALPMARGVPDQGPEEIEEDEDLEPAPEGFVASLDGHYFDPAEGKEVSYRVRRLPVAIAASSVAGVLSGLLGVGGGIVKVPVLTLYCDVPMKAAAATSNFMIGVTAVASALVYYGRGDVSPFISAASVVGVFVGSRAGSLVAGRVRGTTLRRVFAVVMILIAIQLIWKSLTGGIR